MIEHHKKLLDTGLCNEFLFWKKKAWATIKNKHMVPHHILKCLHSTESDHENAVASYKLGNTF